MPLSHDSQSPLFNASPSPNGYPNGYLDKHSNSDIDYLNDKLDSDAIKAL